MHDLGVLRDLAIIAGLALPVVALAHRLHLPPLAGFLVVGVLIGPSGTALIPDPEAVAALSEIGVVLLLFEIGLELSLSDVLRWGRSVAIAGGAQMAGMLALAVAAGTALDIPLGRVLFYGALVAMSSTAAVTKLYADRGELDTPHGREAVSILLFQDLCIVPIMALLPLLAGTAGRPGAPSVWVQLLVSLGAMVALVVGGRFAVRWTLDRVVSERNRDLFTLCVGFFAIGTALVSAAAGFSLAIGAFLAGLIISESEYGQQALSDVIPFRVLFSGVFFTSIGMLLDLSLLVEQPLLVVGAAVSIVALKTVVATGAIMLRGRPLDISLRSGLGLAQVGEFSFVLAAAGLPLGLFAGDDYQTFLSVAALSLMATPFLIGSARRLAEAAATRLAGAARRAAGGNADDGDMDVAGYRDHAVVIGYGLAGRYLARMLRAAGIRCAVIDQNLDLVRQARADGVPAVYGDGTRHALLERVAGAHARIIVFAIPSSTEERRGVAAARELAPAARIVVRTRYVRAIDELQRLGADAVVVEEFEASLELFKRALEGYEIPAGRIAHELDAVRSEHYGLLRGTAAPDLALNALQHLGIHDALELVEVEAGSRAIGENARTLDLRRRTGAIQVAVVRDGAPIYRRDDAFRYASGDTAILVGDREALGTAAALFRGVAP
ncbi:MAG: cation:proton antiporter [Acidobacteria bacterium]|nr:cation:proton antiporter [Acidobacteriota bacterium]